MANVQQGDSAQANHRSECGDIRHNGGVSTPCDPVPADPASTGQTPDRPLSPVDFAALVRDAHIAIVFYDPSGTVRSWNNAATELLGHTSDDTLGRAAPHLPVHTRLPTAGHRLARRRHRDGRIVEVSATVSPVYGAGGAVVGWSEILRAPDLVPAGSELEEGDLAEALSDALQNGELALMYQPIFGLSDRKPIGAEALLRWNRPGHGTVLPDRFIHVAERDGLIDAIGLFVIRAACQQIACGLRCGESDMPLSVNVSACQFRQVDFARLFARIIRDTGIDATRLKLEITESALIDDPVSASARLDELRALGVRVAIDDFGVGYSSLSRLRQYHIDTLKIDHSFVRDIASDPTSREVVGAVIALAHKLGMNVVAEGIETSAQAETLVQLGCDAGQGFLLAHAMPADELAGWA